MTNSEIKSGGTVWRNGGEQAARPSKKGGVLRNKAAVHKNGLGRNYVCAEKENS